MATSTKPKLEELLDELIEAELDFQGFAQKHHERISELHQRLAEQLVAQGLIADWRERP
jgi:hypothetical protein